MITDSSSYIKTPSGARLFAATVPDQEAQAHGVQPRSKLIVRMDLHPRPSCIMVQGAPPSSVVERLGLLPDEIVEEWLSTLWG